MARAVLILLGVYALSILIRAPYLTRPLSKGDEWMTAHMLTTLQIWTDEGAAKYQFNPIMTFPHEGDRYITSIPGEMDKKGNFYYVSYPPFAFYFTYFVFSIFHVYPDVLPLRILNLFLQGVSAFFLYLVLLKIYSKKFRNGVFLPALIAFTSYLFIPQNLWYLSNMYFSEILIQPFWIIHVFVLLHFVKSEKPTRLTYVFLVLSFFMMAFTEWLGFIYGFCILGWTFLRYRKSGKYRLLFISVVASLTLVLILTFWRFSLIDGFSHAVQAMYSRYYLRGGLTPSDHTLLTKAQHIFGNYVNWYTYFALIPISYLTYFIFFIKGWGKYRALFGHPLLKTVLFLTGTPVVVHLLFFANWTDIHLFSVLKSTFFVCILCGVLSREIFDKLRNHRWMIYGIFATNVLIFLFVGMRYKQYFTPILNSDAMFRLGEHIKNNAHPEDTVMITGDIPNIPPQILFYAKRNIFLAENDGKAMEHFKNYGGKCAQIFTVDSAYTLQSEHEVCTDQ
jgi:hypothetical protein